MSMLWPLSQCLAAEHLWLSALHFQVLHKKLSLYDPLARKPLCSGVSVNCSVQRLTPPLRHCKSISLEVIPCRPSLSSLLCPNPVALLSVMLCCWVQRWATRAAQSSSTRSPVCSPSHGAPHHQEDCSSLCRPRRYEETGKLCRIHELETTCVSVCISVCVSVSVCISCLCLCLCLYLCLHQYLRPLFGVHVHLPVHQQAPARQPYHHPHPP